MLCDDALALETEQARVWVQRAEQPQPLASHCERWRPRLLKRLLRHSLGLAWLRQLQVPSSPSQLGAWAPLQSDNATADKLGLYDEALERQTKDVELRLVLLADLLHEQRPDHQRPLPAL